MEKSEEKELKEITAEFTKGVQVFSERKYPEALKMFDAIIEKYEDSEFFSTAEVHAKAKVYRAICDSQLNPVELKLETDEDYLNNGVFYLNAGNYEKAGELFETLENRKYKDPYLHYLFSIVYMKQKDQENALKFLKKCIKKDSFYKTIAYNEPDFFEMFENSQFRSLVE